MLKAQLNADAPDADLLTALLEIAPDDRDVMTAVVGATLSVDIRVSDRPSQALRKLDGAIIDLALSEAARTVATGGEAQRKAVANLLICLAPKRPQVVASILSKLLHRNTGQELVAAVTAVGELPAPRPAELVSAVIRIAVANDGFAGNQALSVLASIGTDAAPAQELFLDVIRSNTNAPPLFGNPDSGADRLSRAAEGIAAACPTVRAVPPLLTWLGRLERARKSASNHLSWNKVGPVVEALTVLAPRSTAVKAAILSSLATAQRCIADDESGVLSLHWYVRRAFARLPAGEAMFRRAEKLGMPRDPYRRENVASKPVELPRIPDDDEPDPHPGWQPLDGEELRQQYLIAAEGCLELGLGEHANPRQTAKAVERWLVKMQRRKRPVAADVLDRVISAWADAVGTQTGWDWGCYPSEGGRVLALISPDRTSLHLPGAFISGQLKRGAEMTAEILLNRLAAGGRRHNPVPWL